MEKSNLQKMKLLFLMEMLRQDSDEAHPMTTKVICTRLAEKGAPKSPLRKNSKSVIVDDRLSWKTQWTK